LFFNGLAPKDVWVYNESVPGTYNNADWTQLTSDWGAVGGARVLFSWCVHENELYMAGGQTAYVGTPTMFTDIVKYNEGTNQWVKTGDLPISFFSTGTMVSSGSVFTAGQTYIFDYTVEGY